MIRRFLKEAMLSTIERNLSQLQLRGLKRFGSSVNKLGVNFAACDAADKVILLSEGGKFKSDKEQLIESSRQVLNQNNKESDDEKNTQVYSLGKGNRFLAVALKSNGKAAGAALIDTGETTAEHNSKE